MVKSQKTKRAAAAPASGPRKPVSLRDLAAHLGLSRTTVSLVLNDAPLARSLSPATRARVLKAAEELNYKANYFARSLNGKHSLLIGILSPDMGEGYDSELLTNIERYLIKRDYLYFVSSHYWDAALIQNRMESFSRRGVEGMILINTSIPGRMHLPAVSIGHPSTNGSASSVSSVSIDNAFGVKVALEHLVSLGHRKIAFFKGQEGSADTEERWHSYLAASRALRLEARPDFVVQLERIDQGLDPIREGYSAAQKLLRQARGFTALVAFNDMSAIGAMHAFRDAGFRVPKEISIVGFDDVQAASIVYPPLTTVRQPLDKIGMLAAREVLDKIENASRKSVHTSIQPELIVRRSTAPPPV